MLMLETLFTPMQKPELAEAIWKRYSCRDYIGTPTTEEWAALSYAAQRYALPGARLYLTRVEEGMFSGALLNIGKIIGCTTAAVVIASATEERSRIHAGILGEAFCLEAVRQGLACCWLSNGYKKKQLQVPLKADEAVLAVIAFGPPVDQLPKVNRKRKPLERICDGDVTQWPEEMWRVAEAVRQAPSAMNMQPWQMHLSGSRFVIDTPERAQLDLGVALCHAELTLNKPHTWHFGASRKEAAAWAQAK